MVGEVCEKVPFLKFSKTVSFTDHLNIYFFKVFEVAKHFDKNKFSKQKENSV